MKKIVILGSPGSIGASTLDIIERFPDRFSVLGLVAGTSDEKLEEQIRTFKPQIAAMSDPQAAKRLRNRLNNSSTKILEGTEGIKEVACHPDSNLVISAIVGAAGLVPTLAAIEAGQRVALANKEPVSYTHLTLPTSDLV